MTDIGAIIHLENFSQIVGVFALVFYQLFDGEYLHPGETIKRKEEATEKKKRHQLDFLQE